MEKQNSLSRLADLFVACLTILFGMGLILCTKGVSAAAAQGLALCGRVVIPALFPFLVLSSLCLSTGLGAGLSRLLARPMERLFHLPGSCAPALVLGLIGGYPVGARTAFDLYDRRLCSREECSRLLTFCSCCGPAFLVSAVGATVFGSVEAGLVLYACHIAAAAIIGFVQGRFLPKPKKELPDAVHHIRQSFARSFTSAVTSAFSTMLNVCAFVIFFAALMALLAECGCLALGQKLLFFLPPSTADLLLRGLLELTNGIAALGAAPALALPQAMGLSGLLCGWGGLSVHAQVLSLREARNIPMGRYFIGKAIHGLLSGMFSYISAFYFLRDLPLHTVFQPQYELSPTTVINPLYYILVCGVYLAACLAVTGLVVWLEDREARKGGCQTDKKSV